MTAPRLNALGQPIGPPLDQWQPPARPSATVLDGVFARLERLDVARHGRTLFEANGLDPEGRNWTYLPVGPFEAFDDYAAWLGEMAAKSDPYFFAIVDAQSSRPVGVASYLRVDPAAGSIEVGHINFSPLVQRTSVASEAMFLLMRHAFALGYRRYEWKCDSLNEPSRAAALRLGFSYEGLFRQATIYKGRSRDTAWYSILDSEFPALERAFTAWLDPANRDAAGQQRQRLADLIAACRQSR